MQQSAGVIQTAPSFPAGTEKGGAAVWGKPPYFTEVLAADARGNVPLVLQPAVCVLAEDNARQAVSLGNIAADHIILIL